MEADSIAGAEYTEPSDPRFTPAQQKATAARIGKFTGHYVWLLCDTPEKWHVFDAKTRVEAQALIGVQCRDWRVWLVHVPRAKPAKYCVDPAVPVSAVVRLGPMPRGRPRRREVQH